MTPALRELLDVMMLEEFTARREGVMAWSRKWVATAEVQFVADGAGAMEVEAESARRKIIGALMSGDVPVFSFSVERALEYGASAVRGVVQVHVVRTKPVGS